MLSARNFPTGLKIAISTFTGALLLALAIIVLVAPNSAIAAGGDLDLSLNSGSGFDGGPVYTVLVQPDGNILVGGGFTTYQGQPAKGIARIKPTGDLDTTFTGSVTGGGASVRSIALQSDGKIIIGGDFVTVTTSTRNGIARLLTTGAIDTTFVPTNNGISGIANGNRVEAVAVAYDNKIYAGGSFSQITGSVTISNIVRYNIGGPVDSTFASGNGVITGTNGVVYAIEPLADKRVLIAGDFTNYKGNVVNSSKMAIIGETGTPDTSFTSPATSTVYDIAPAGEGKYLIAGGVSAKVARLDLTGTLDNTFNPGGGADNNVLAVAVQADGKIILGGQFQNFSNQATKGIVRLLSSGTVDTGFAINPGVDGAVNELAVQTDGKVLVVGAFQNFGATLAHGIVRLLPAPGTLNLELNTYSVREGSSVNITVNRTGGTDNAVVARLGITDLTTTPDDYSGLLGPIGKRDPSFAPAAAFTRSIFSLRQLPDGDLVAAGGFYNVEGTSRDYLERFNPDGSIDSSLGAVTWIGTGLSVVTVQADGKLLVGGAFTTTQGVARGRIARLLPDGSVDAFNPNFGNGEVKDIVVQPDGKILVGGSFTGFNGNTRNRIVRLNVDGSVDGTFVPVGNGPASANAVVYSIALQQDGKILLAGEFTGYSSRNRLIRLNRDGSLDSSFVLASVGGSAGPNAQLDKVIVQPDGKILVVGSLDNYEAHYIQRFNPDGSVDATFNNNAKLNSPDNPVKSVALQPDGKIIIGGDFTIFSDISVDPPLQVAARRGIARLNADGSLDNSFDPGSGLFPVGGDVNTPTSIYALLVQPDGKILAGGDFAGYNGQIVPPFVRIFGDLFVSWAAGETGPKTVTFTPADDKLMENTEQLRLSLDNLLGGVTVGATPTATVSILDNDVTVNLVSSANPGQYGRTVFTATITPITATGTVSFTTDGGMLLGAVPLNNLGQAVITPANLAVGTYTITATYLGDTNFSSNAATLTNQVIVQATPLITITSTPNPSNFQENATFTVTVDPLGATGTVTVTRGAEVLASGALIGGIFTFDKADLPPGSNVISATYEGDGNVLPGTSANYTHTVTCPLALTASTDDGSGTTCGTLSYALKQVATSNTPVTITLPANLQLTGPLPTVTPTVAVVIDGGCTAGAPGTAITAGTGAGSTGITLTANLTLQGVKITGFSGTAVKVTGNNNKLNCNWIGTTNGTTTDAASTGVGLEISGSNNMLGTVGNLASGNVIRSKGKNALRVLPGAKANFIYYTKVATT